LTGRDNNKLIMNRSKRFIVLAFAGLALLFSYCRHDKNCKETRTSAHGDSESRNMSNNCMDCHTMGGRGPSCFVVGGTVYDSVSAQTYADATVYLYSQPNGQGQMVQILEADANGNFYTTENVNFGTGVYPVVIGNTGKPYFMPTLITMGACNSCHGITTGRIYIR
jgi:hypothetical protein